MEKKVNKIEYERNRAFSMISLVKLKLSDFENLVWVKDKKQIYLKKKDNNSDIVNGDRRVSSRDEQDVMISYSDDKVIIEVTTYRENEVLKEEETTAYQDYNETAKFIFAHDKDENILSISQIVDGESFVEDDHETQSGNVTIGENITTKQYITPVGFNIFDLPSISLNTLEPVIYEEPVKVMEKNIPTYIKPRGNYYN